MPGGYLTIGDVWQPQTAGQVLGAESLAANLDDAAIRQRINVMGVKNEMERQAEAVRLHNMLYGNEGTPQQPVATPTGTMPPTGTLQAPTPGPPTTTPAVNPLAGPVMNYGQLAAREEAEAKQKTIMAEKARPLWSLATAAVTHGDNGVLQSVIKQLKSINALPADAEFKAGKADNFVTITEDLTKDRLQAIAEQTGVPTIANLPPGRYEYNQSVIDPTKFSPNKDGQIMKSVKDEASDKWQPWGHGQMRNVDTGKIEKVPVKPDKPDKPEKPVYTERQARSRLSAIEASIARLKGTNAIDALVIANNPLLAGLIGTKDPEAIAATMEALKEEKEYVSGFIPGKKQVAPPMQPAVSHSTSQGNMDSQIVAKYPDAKKTGRKTPDGKDIWIVGGEEGTF